MSVSLPFSRLVLLVAGALGGCSSTPDGTPIVDIADEINATRLEAGAWIVPGDTLEVRFPLAAEYDQPSVVVGPSGKAVFLALGELLVAGRTLLDVQSSLQQRYAELLTSAELSLSLKVPAERSFSVIGEVGQPGRYPMPPDGSNIIEGLALAGGHVRDSARLERTVLVRWSPAEERMRSWAIDMRPRYFGSPKAVMLQPHDVIFVPPTAVVHVNDWIDRYIRLMLPFPYAFAR